MESFFELKYSDFNTLSKIKQYYNYLKQILILKINLNYDLEEIKKLLDNLQIENEFKDHVLKYCEHIIKNGKKEFVNLEEINFLNLKQKVNFWYQQFVDFGIIEGKKHYPNLIIYKFQIEEIEHLITEYEKYLNDSAMELIRNYLERLYNNEFLSYSGFQKSFFTFLKGKIKNGKLSFPEKEIKEYGNFLKEKIIWSENEALIIQHFLGRLRYIVLCGKYDKFKEEYVPFFVNAKITRGKDKIDLEKIIKGYLETRLIKIIKIYFSHLTTPLKIEFELHYKQYLKLPKINFKILEPIAWDFMPENQFYDGVNVEEKRGNNLLHYIQIHPLSMFFCYFNKEDFEIFIDQLLHHEFVHFLMSRFNTIYDKLINNPIYSEKYPNEWKLFRDTAYKRWIPEDYHLYESKEENILYEDLNDLLKRKGFSKLSDFYRSRSGGHSMTFAKEMNKFKDCKKVMKRRGQIQTIYNAFYYKIWGKDMPLGFWFLCDAKST